MSTGTQGRDLASDTFGFYIVRMRTNSANLFLLLKAACHHVTVAASARATRRVGVHGAQALALLALRERPSCTVTELADAAGLKMSATASLVDRLVRDGWVERSSNPNDRRAVMLALTGSGQDAAEGVVEMVATFDQSLRGDFTAEELAIVARFLNHAMEAL